MRTGFRSLWRFPLAAPLALIVLVLLAFANSLRTPFLFDDLSAVTHNPSIRSWATAFRPPDDGRASSGRPVVNASLALNYALSGTRPAGYHAFNLAIHALAAAALFGILRLTLEKLRRPGDASNFAQTTAFLAAALWAVHPLQTESVTSIAQRTESLCGLFLLATFYFFIRGVRESRRVWLALSVGACLLGMGTKEVMVAAPLLVLLYDRSFESGGFRSAWRQRRGFYGALFGTWLWLGWLVLAGGGTRGSAAGLGLGVSWWGYLLKQSEALVLYLKLALWPFPLVVDYGTAVVESWREVWWQGPAVLLLVGLAAWAVGRRPRLGFLGAWFFLILAPSSSVVPLVTQTMAEHRMYLPLAALTVPFALAANRLGRIGALAAGLAALAAAATTAARNEVYRSEISLWRDTVRHRPENPRAHVNLGVALSDAGRQEEAIKHFETALALQPADARMRVNLAAAFLRVGRSADAAAHAERAVELDPKSVEARINLAQALAQLGRSEPAVAQYRAALQLAPGAGDAHARLGVELLKLGQVDAAVSHLETALGLDARQPENWCHLARAKLRRNDPAGARRACEEALRLDAAFAEAHFILGNLEAAAGNFPGAIAGFQRATELAPDYLAARNNLANALLMNGQADAAILHYRKILQQRPDDRSVQENLARALELRR